YDVNLETPYKNLPEDFKKVLLHGSADKEIEFTFFRAGKQSKIKRPFEGVIPNMERLYAESESEFTRNRLKGFKNPQPCDACDGKRLKPEILVVTLGGTGVPPEIGDRGNTAITSRIKEKATSSNEIRRDAEFNSRDGCSSRKIPGLSIMD